MGTNVLRGTCRFCLENGGSRFGTFLLRYNSAIFWNTAMFMMTVMRP